MKIKKALCFALVMSFILTGCSFEISDGNLGNNEDGTVGKSVVPSGALQMAVNSTISLNNDIEIFLPTGYKYAIQEIAGATQKTYFVWNNEEDYILPYSNDVLFYILEDTDIYTPTQTLNDTNALASLKTYGGIFRTATGGTGFVFETPLINDENYVAQLMGNSKENLLTTYNTLCYEKMYYGIQVVPVKKEEDSRHWTMFIFSNNKEGEIMNESDYTSLLNQVKSKNAISNFYVLPINKGTDKDYSQGMTYEMYENYMLPVTEYYILQKNIKEQVKAVD